MRNKISEPWLYILLAAIVVVIGTFMTVPETGRAILLSFLGVSLLFFIILVIRIPVVIAKYRRIGGWELKTISTLSWLGILFGITWVIALAFSLIWEMNRKSVTSSAGIEILEKLSRLRDSGAITEEEYEIQKNRLLKE